MKNLQGGRWFDVVTSSDHESLKRYGTLSVNSLRYSTPVQKGQYVGPGRYLLLSYDQPCPRGCCRDNVHEVLSAKQVIDSVKEQARVLAYILREARKIPNDLLDTSG